MGKGTKESPYTREDVLRLIEENGGKAEGLDLSGKVFEEAIDLRGLNKNYLQGIILNKAIFPLNLKRLKKDCPLRGANLKGVHLEGAYLRSTHLEESDLSDTYLDRANLCCAHLEGANLSGIHFGNAYLGYAYLQGAILLRADFSANAGLEDVDWGDYILGDEEELSLDMAVDTYRRLKVWYTNAGISDTAAKFYYREKEASRKAAKRRRDRLAGWLSWAVFGHGEGWKRILFWIAGIILLFTMVYFVAGFTWQWPAFWRSLYFSTVSFTALGYGSWVWVTNDWIKGIGAFESLVGVSMLALLLVTFFRKWTR